MMTIGEATEDMFIAWAVFNVLTILMAAFSDIIVSIKKWYKKK